MCLPDMLHDRKFISNWYCLVGRGWGVGEWWTAGHETRILARPFPKGTVPPQNQYFNSHLKCLSTKLSEHWELCSQWHTCNKCLVPTTVFKMRVWSQCIICINSGENIALHSLCSNSMFLLLVLMIIHIYMASTTYQCLKERESVSDAMVTIN